PSRSSTPAPCTERHARSWTTADRTDRAARAGHRRLAGPCRRVRFQGARPGPALGRDRPGHVRRRDRPVLRRGGPEAGDHDRDPHGRRGQRAAGLDDPAHARTGAALMAERKAYPLRIGADVLSAAQKWADDELRSLNAQIEYVLRDALRKAGRLPQADAPQDQEEDRP